MCFDNKVAMKTVGGLVLEPKVQITAGTRDKTANSLERNLFFPNKEGREGARSFPCLFPFWRFQCVFCVVVPAVGPWRAATSDTSELS